MSELCSVCAAGIHGIPPPPIRSRVGVSESSATNVRNSFVASSLPSELRIDPHVIGFLAHDLLIKSWLAGVPLGRCQRATRDDPMSGF